MIKKLLIATLLLTNGQAILAAEQPVPKAPAATPTKCALTGTWKSNKEKTMPALNKNISIPVDVKARMANLFGQVTISYNESCTQAKANVNGKMSTLNFNVVKSDKSSITVKDTKTNNQHLMRFEGDCYLMEVQGAGVDEYYCRVDEKK